MTSNTTLNSVAFGSMLPTNAFFAISIGQQAGISTPVPVVVLDVGLGVGFGVG